MQSSFHIEDEGELRK